MCNYDLIIFNGPIFTSDINNKTVNVIGVKNGYVTYIGNQEDIAEDIKVCPNTIDLNGKFAMPGLIDSHMHPFWGAKQLVETSLDYQSLDIDGILTELQKDLDEDKKSANTDDDWFIVRAWLCIGGTFIDRASLDKLKTNRPIVLFSNDCHYLSLNTIALEKINILNNAPVPDNGVIVLDEHNHPTGLIEDGAAMEFFDKITASDVEHGIYIFDIAQKKLNSQGVTTIMDARALDEEFKIFKEMENRDILTLRILGAFEVKKRDVIPRANFQEWISRYQSFVSNYSTAKWSAAKPSLYVHQSKFFIDGMMPSHTAYMLEPYFERKDGKLVPTTNYGQSYLSQDDLEFAFLECAKLGIDPHAHTIADGAINIALNAIENFRNLGFTDIRPALAHCDVTAPEQYARFKNLDVSANLSFQWSGYPQNMIDLHHELLGDEQIKVKFETHGKFFDAGVNVAYNSDWPIDPMNEWFNLQVGLTRRIDQTTPRLDSDRNLTPLEVLKAATINAAYALKKEKEIGSLELNKFADIIVLDQNPFEIDPNLFSTIQVMKTIIGGHVVYEKNKLEN